MARARRSNTRQTRPPTPGPWSARILIAPGLEELLQAELEELGIPSTLDVGAVEARVDAAQLQRIHHFSRLAARVTVKLGTVGAQSLEQLADRVRKLPWKLYVDPRQPLEVQATCHRSRLRHRDRVASKVELAIGDALRGPRRGGGRPPREPARVGVRVVEDKATIRVDASGDLLHKRGWRQEGGRAPMRENLACAVLRATGWQPGEPLVDPMCGSGTFAIEAAGMTLGRSLGDGRDFAYMRWPCWSAGAAPNRPPTRDAGALILGADRDERSVQRASKNARRARVDARVLLRESAVEHLDPLSPGGLIVINPPWGQRLGAAQLGRIHAGWASHLEETWPAWRVAVIVPDQGWSRTAWGGRAVARFKSGGVRVVVRLRDAGAPRVPEE